MYIECTLAAESHSGDHAAQQKGAKGAWEQHLRVRFMQPSWPLKGLVPSLHSCPRRHLYLRSVESRTSPGMAGVVNSAMPLCCHLDPRSGTKNLFYLFKSLLTFLL